MHRGGARLCSACSGVFLLAETGLFDGKDATVHFGYAAAFSACYPAVPIHPERVLVISGAREDLVSSGASNTWHDMVLYLIAHHVGATVAQEVARLFALQWHQDGLAPYMIFEGRNNHGDGEIQSAQAWLANNFSIANPVEEMIKRPKLAERTFKRRFAAATGLAPIAMYNACGSRTPSAASNVPVPRWTRLVGASVTRTPHSSGGCSSAPRE